MPIRVLVCDDVKAFRVLMRHVLEEDPVLHVVGEAADGDQVVDTAAATCPDVVLLDLAMPVCDGMSAIPRLRAVAPDARIVVLSGFEGDLMREPCLERGAHAYLTKGSELEDICSTVRQVALAA